MTMRLKISHTTTYTYDAPVAYALQQLRLRPKSRPGQTVLRWDVDVEGGTKQALFEDEHANSVDLVSFLPQTTQVTVHSHGEVEVEDQKGIVGPQKSCVPLWLYQRPTPQTVAGAKVTKLLGTLEKTDDRLAQLHALSAHILASLPYSTEQTNVTLSAEDALGSGHGVCQDHAHVFLAAARSMDIPARYVSGYLMLQDSVDQTASHAWAEAHIDGLGWVGFDISNGISPDARYVRVATGLDYYSAAPIRGMRQGSGTEDLEVQIQVQQQ